MDSKTIHDERLEAAKRDYLACGSFSVSFQFGQGVWTEPPHTGHDAHVPTRRRRYSDNADYLDVIVMQALRNGARVEHVTASGYATLSLGDFAPVSPLAAVGEVDEEIEAEWDDTPVFAADKPDVIRANMTPVSDEWLTRAYRAVFPRAE